MDTTFIYVLKCPESNNVRYVGKANNPKKRYYEHLRKDRTASTHKINWISSLLDKGLKPVLEVIDEVSITEWKYWERYYISKYKSMGFDIVNYQDGGDGLTMGNQTSFKKGHIRKVKVERLKKKCVICGVLFEISPSELNKYKCCSMECSSVYRGKNPNKGTFKKGVNPWNKDKSYNFINSKNNTPVIMIDKSTGDIVGEYNSISLAALSTGVKACNICGALTRKSGYSSGYIWRRKG